MKANINGVEVEGTPEEIAALMVIVRPTYVIQYPQQYPQPYTPFNPYVPYQSPWAGDPPGWWQSPIVTCTTQNSNESKS